MGGLTNHPGKWLNDAAAADFNRAERDHGKFAVNSAGRSVAEQQHLINRWNQGGASNRPPYLYQPANPATSSNHVSGGGRAVDLADWRRFATIAGHYNFRHPYPGGDPVHFEHTGATSGAGTSPSAIYDQWGGKPWIIAVQNKLIALGYDLGSWGADGDPGTLTQGAIRDVQQKAGLVVDGIAGPVTNAELDRRLLPNQGWPRFPLSFGQYFGPEGGGDNSISGWHSHGSDLMVWQKRMAERGWVITADGKYGPRGATTPQGETAKVAGEFQAEKGLKVDKLIGPETWDTAWTSPITPPPTTPPPTTPPVIPPALSEIEASPKLVTPAAKDFPSWIRYEETLETLEPLHNVNAAKYYQKQYIPIESHTHWWGEPGKAGTHDGNVSHLNSSKDVSANYVTSAGRITLMVPLNKVALTTGQRNPYAWKSENDPALTDLGYRTLGYLHYIVEKLNPSLKDEPIRLHKEFYPTGCSEIQVAQVRMFANQFATGILDPATGLAPDVPDPLPEPEPEPEPQPILIEVNAANLVELQMWASSTQEELEGIQEWLDSVIPNDQE